MSDAIVVRKATEADVAAITAIYNEVIRTTDAIWLDEEVTLEDRRAWFADQRALEMAVLVAVPEDAPSVVLGYGSLAPFRTKSGYWPTVEHSIHVHADHRGRGVGQLLLDALVARARADGRQVMVAGIDAGNTGSIRFHERNGFRVVADMPAVGRKYGRTVSLVLLQREIGADADVDVDGDHDRGGR